MTREQKIEAVWNATHWDFKGTYYGTRAVMVCRDGVTMMVPVDRLTDEEIEVRLPKKVAH